MRLVIMKICVLIMATWMLDCNRDSQQWNGCQITVDGRRKRKNQHLQIQCACSECQLVFAVGYGHCSNVIFYSLLDFSGTPIHSTTHNFHMIFYFTCSSQQIRSVACNNENIFQFHLDMIRCIFLRKLPVYYMYARLWDNISMETIYFHLKCDP